MNKYVEFLLKPLAELIDRRQYKSTIVAWGFVVVAGLFLITGLGDKDQGLPAVPALQWIAAVLAVIGIALYFIGVAYRARQTRGRLGRPARLR